jgi:hypothetical protein
MAPTETQYRDRVHTTPDSLLVDPCVAKEAGWSVRSLSIGYVENTSCIAKYKSLLERQREHKKKIAEIYDATPE